MSSDRAATAKIVPRMLAAGPLNRGQVAELMTTCGMAEERVGQFIETLPGGNDASLDLSGLIEDVFGADGVAAMYLAQHGITPTEADIAYFSEQKVKATIASFLATIQKMKPLDIHKFGADFFSGALADQKRLVLISDDVEETELLMDAVKPIGCMGAEIVTATWQHDGSPADFTSKLDSLVQQHGKFKTTALCCHHGGDDAEKWFPFKSHGIDLAQGTEDPGIADVFKSLADATTVRLDILACCLTASDKGKAWLQKKEKEMGMNFAASADVTGNPEAGGNWVLETDGINLCSVYFDAEKIGQWQGTLRVPYARRRRVRRSNS